MGYISAKGQVFKGTHTQQLQLRHSEPISVSVLNPRSDRVLIPRAPTALMNFQAFESILN